MNKFELMRKTSAMSLINLPDLAKSEENIIKTQLSLIMEASDILTTCKDLLVELRLKDKLIKDDRLGILGKVIESEIAKLAFKELEQCQGTLWYT